MRSIVALTRDGSMRNPVSPLSALALAAVAPAMVSAQDAPSWAGTEYAQVTIHERISIRIRPRSAAAKGVVVPQQVWSEKKAAKCVPVARLAGAALSGGGDVDLMIVDGSRIRAKLDEDCPALEFYAGFYLARNPDGQICAKRDTLRARSGASCPIAQFKTLVARK